jgi:GMP synthase-like glutamine amidotransferase
MSVLILKNIVSEGPGTIEKFLKDKSVPYRIAELGSGEPAPSLENFDTLIILGGPMAVYEMDDFPHLAVASRLIREAINRQMKVLGICLGAQLIAHCLGAEVYRGPGGPEVGWLPIELTADGVRDPLMRKLAVHPRVGDFWNRFKVFHWHGDTFDLPMGARRLARSAIYENQAFCLGDTVYAFQFHIEVTEKMVGEWLSGEPDFKRTLKETASIYDEYLGRAMAFYRAFFAEADMKLKKG